ncbi:phage tail protein [Paenibacillus sp. FSL R7-0026]|uniref:phage tail protein n=1 Tax=Paenibacillus sp. FSL R7-0026 TaxID=2921668 RepID=UPI0030FB303A
MSSAGHVDLDLGLNYGAFQQQLNGISSTATNLVGGAFKKLGGIVAAAFAVNSLKDFGKEAINLASDLAEVQNVVNVTFGSMTNQINNWSSNLIESFGLSELSGKRYASTMGAMLKSSGITGEAMKQMSVKLTELSADMASFYNITNDEAYYKVFSGMVGETEPLKQLGVNMSVVNMEAYAMSQGITKSWLSMTQSEQAMLRYGYLLQVTADAQGDFARNGQSWANQVRMMSEQWNIFKGTMGAGFINILTPILKGLNWIIAKLQVAAAYFKAFTELVFGDAVNAGGAGMTVATDAMGGMGDAAAAAAPAVEDTGKAAEKAGKKAKKAGKDMKGSLAGFDQLNTLAQSAASALDDAGSKAKGAGAGIGGLGAMAGFGDLDLGTPSIEIDPIKQQVAAFLEDVKSRFSKAWTYISSGWGEMRPALQPFIDMMVPIRQSVSNMGKTFLDLKDKVLVPVAKYILGDFIPTIVTGFVKSFAPVIANQIVWTFDFLDRTFRNSTDQSIKLWDTVWLPSLEKVKNAFVTNMPLIAASLQSLLDGTLNPFTDFMINDFAIPVSTVLAETLVPIFTDTLVWAIDTFAKTFDNAVNHINDLWDSTLNPALEKFRDLFLDIIPQIGDSFDNLLNGTIKPFVDYALNEFIIPIASKITETLVPIFTDVLVKAFEEAAKTFKWAVDMINDIYNTVLKPVFDLIKKIVLDTLQIVKDLWNKYGKDILDKISEMMENTRKLFQKLWDDVLKPIIEPFLKKLNEIWDGTLKGIIKQVGEVVMKLVSAALDIYNKFIVPLISYIIDKLAPSFTKGFNIVLNIVTTVIESVGGIIKGLLKTLGGVIDFVAGVFTGDWKKAWTGVKDIFGGIFDSLYSLVKAPLNLIIDGINKVIGGFNSLSVSIPEFEIFGNKVGGGSVGLPNLPKIPKLAKGGLAYGPTLAMVGDNRGASVDPEVVSPLSKLQDMISGNNQPMVEVLLLILDALRNNDKQTVIQLNGTELGRAAVSAINDITRRQGRSPLTT